MLKTWIDPQSGDAASIVALMEAAPYFGIDTRRGLLLLSNLESAVSRWRQIGKKIGMTASELEAIEPAFEHEERLHVHQILKS